MWEQSSLFPVILKQLQILGLSFGPQGSSEPRASPAQAGLSHPHPLWHNSWFLLTHNGGGRGWTKAQGFHLGKHCQNHTVTYFTLDFQNLEYLFLALDFKTVAKT